VCVILRGLPGSGKSTSARRHAAATMSRGQRCEICSADDFFVGVGGGTYAFDASRLSVRSNRRWLSC
jgi:predicted kinase